MKIKDLKIAYNVLSELDYSIPKDLLVHIAQKIRSQELGDRIRVGEKVRRA